MAFDKTPTSWFASWSEDGTDITVPIASFRELTAAEADGANGDIRDIMFAILEEFWQVYNGLATADRPAKVVLTKTAGTDMKRGVLKNTFTFQIETDINSQEVRDESSSSPSASPSSSPSASVSSSPSSSVSASPSSSPSASVSSSPSASTSSTPSSSPSSSPSAT